MTTEKIEQKHKNGVSKLSLAVDWIVDQVDRNAVAALPPAGSLLRVVEPGSGEVDKLLRANVEIAIAYCAGLRAAGLSTDPTRKAMLGFLRRFDECKS